MGVLPADFRDHAERISGEGNEMTRRCVISRKYYYVFHFLRENFDSHPDSNFSYKGGGDHREAPNFLSRTGNGHLAKQLTQLRDRRNEADYDINDDIDDMELAMFETDVEDFIRELKSTHI